LFKLNWIVLKCDGIHYAVYDCEWYSLHPKEAKDLLLFIMKVNKSVYLTAGKVFPVNMLMFSNVRCHININFNEYYIIDNFNFMWFKLSKRWDSDV